MKKTILIIIGISIVIIIGMVILFATVFGKSLFTGNFISPVYKPVPSCSGTLWSYVYNSSRLKIIDKCISVTGTVVSSWKVNDGDQHILLFPDKQYLQLLNQKNVEQALSSLVIEPICSHDPTIVDNSTLLDAGVGLAEGAMDEDAIIACKGFVSRVYIPSVGEHVRITGSYVLDTWHGWMEIHPVSKIEVLK